MTTSSYIKLYPRVLAIPGDDKELCPGLFSVVFEWNRKPDCFLFSVITAPRLEGFSSALRSTILIGLTASVKMLEAKQRR